MKKDVSYVHSLMSNKDLRATINPYKPCLLSSKDTESKALCSFYQKKPSQTLGLASQKLSVNTRKSPYKQAYYLSRQISTKVGRVGGWVNCHFVSCGSTWQKFKKKHATLTQPQISACNIDTTTDLYKQIAYEAKQVRLIEHSWNIFNHRYQHNNESRG